MKRLAIAFSFILAACAPLQSRDGDVTLRAERLSSGQIRLTLHNGSSAPVGYNLCTAVLERESGTTWSQVRTDEVCTMEIRSLPAGESATFDKTLPSALQPGSYRYVANVESPAGTPQDGIASNAFTVP